MHQLWKWGQKITMKRVILTAKEVIILTQSLSWCIVDYKKRVKNDGAVFSVHIQRYSLLTYCAQFHNLLFIITCLYQDIKYYNVNFVIIEYLKLFMICKAFIVKTCCIRELLVKYLVYYWQYCLSKNDILFWFTSI